MDQIEIGSNILASSFPCRCAYYGDIKTPIMQHTNKHKSEGDSSIAFIGLDIGKTAH